MSRLLAVVPTALIVIGLMSIPWALLPAATADAAAPTPSLDTPLQEFGEMVVGRWVGKVTMLVDWPGFGKKGDSVMGQVTFQWIADRPALEGADFLGTGTNRALYFWDPVVKKIRQTQIDSGGTTWEGWIWKEDGHWISKGTGSYADGTRYEGEMAILIRDGNQLVYKGTIAVAGGNAEAFEDVYTRARDVSAASTNPPEVPYTMRRESGPEIKLPAEFVAECESYLGDWATEAEIDGKVYRGTWKVRWSPDRTCLITHWAADTPNGPGAGTRFEGWDGQAKKVLVVDFGSDGASSIERYRLTSNQVSEGEIVGVSPAGAPFRATARVVRNTPEFFTWTVTRDGHATEYRFRRVAK